MATAFTLPVTAAQVGTYFVGQYYQMLQNQPDFVHQFYSDASTMLRIDGKSRQTASAMLQIHQLVMSLKYLELEINTSHSLESWNGGVLVMVSGYVRAQDFVGRKKFAETFFLAPQEKGYFVLNDIFHYVDEEQTVQHPVAYLPQTNLDSKLNPSVPVHEQVSSFMLSGDIQSRDLLSPMKLNENGLVNNYNYQEQLLPQASQTEKILADRFVVQSNGSLHGTIQPVADHLATVIDEPVQERQKLTYASIVAKAQPTPAPAVTSQSSINKPEKVPEPAKLQSASSGNLHENLEEASAIDDDFEVKSVYVRNVPTTMAASQIAEEFKKFGKLKPDAVAIRTRKDIDVCYAFVEFEDFSGVNNAIEASMVQIGPHNLYIEGRRPNRNLPIRGGRGRGRGRITYQAEGMRGRFVNRGFGRSSQDGTDYSRPRGNGYYRQQGSRNGSE